MKRAITSLTIGACMLLASTGMLLAADPHNPVTGTGTKGQPGTINGNTCNTGTVGPGPGGSANGNGSPFNTSVTPPYAGNPGNPTVVGGTGNNSMHAVSEYDVACFQASQVP